MTKLPDRPDLGKGHGDDRPSRPLLAISLRIGSTFAFAAMNVIVKLLGDRIPIGEIIFARSLLALPPVLMIAWLSGQFADAFRTRNIRGHVIRTIFGFTNLFLMFTSLTLMPIADATAITYASPLVTVVLAAVLLGERVGIYRWSAVIVGLAGVAIIFAEYLPGASGDVPSNRYLLGAGLGFVGTMIGALVGLQIREMHRTETSYAIVVYFTLFSTIAALATIPLGWVMPSMMDFLLLAAIGTLGGLAQVMMTHSFRYADVSSMAPLGYLMLVWTIMLGFVFFQEIPTFGMLAGSVVVMAAGLFVFYRERQLGIAKRDGEPPV